MKKSKIKDEEFTNPTLLIFDFLHEGIENEHKNLFDSLKERMDVVFITDIKHYYKQKYNVTWNLCAIYIKGGNEIDRVVGSKIRESDIRFLTDF